MQVKFSDGTFTSVVFSETLSTCDSFLQCLVFVYLFSFIPRSTCIGMYGLTVEKESKPRYVSRDTFCNWTQTPLFFSRFCALLSGLPEFLLAFLPGYFICLLVQ